MKMFLVSICLMVIQSCSSSLEDTFNSEMLVSSKQEKIYINTLNWGLTDDHQISAISSDIDKVRDRSDTVGTVKGLEPFIYGFKNDTLSLYFDGEVSYRIKEKFNTIHLNYIVLNKKEYREIQTKAYNDEDGYHSVPKRKQVGLPPDMPKPSSN